ncbi:MAG: hypothetical protein KIS92_01440 [Planctomycetota bacterium]|nr:hypothetical protein [Planctomycetota bacterium]
MTEPTQNTPAGPSSPEPGSSPRVSKPGDPRPAGAPRPISGRILPTGSGTHRKQTTSSIRLPMQNPAGQAPAPGAPKRPISGRIPLPAAGAVLAESAAAHAQRARAKTTKSIRLPALTPDGKNVMPERTSLHTSQHWTCHRCGKMVSADRVAQGAATLVNSVLTCGDCLRREQQDKAAGRNKKLIFAGSVAVLGIAALVSLASFLFILFLFAQAAIFVGALGFTLSGRNRLVLAAAGIVVAVCSMVAIRELKSHQESKQENAGLGEDAAAIQELLKKDRLADAQNRLTAIDSRARERSGAFKSPEAQQTVTQARALIDEWFKANYGDLSPQERDVISRLMTFYPDKPGAAQRRINAVKVQGATVKLNVILLEEPKDRQINEDVKDLPYTVFDLFPVLNRVEIQFLYGAGELSAVGTVAMDRAQAESQRQRQATGAPLLLESK